MDKRHRIFIAINLPADAKKNLAKYQEKWADVPAKWVPKDNLHITLVFLGDLVDEEIATVCQAVKEVAEHHNSFNIFLEKIAYGPESEIPFDSAQGKPPRYIWVGGEVNEQALAIKKELEDTLFESIKFKLDKNSFNSHITLARIKEWEWRAIEPEERTEVNENISLTFTVDSIDVMESESTRQGPRYTVIESHQLQ